MPDKCPRCGAFVDATGFCDKCQPGERDRWIVWWDKPRPSLFPKFTRWRKQ